MSFIQQGTTGSTSGGATLVSIAGYTTIGSGSQTVPTAGTRVQLSSVSVPSKAIFIQGMKANSDAIYIGDSTVSSSNGYVVFAGQSIALNPANLNLLYIDSVVNGEGVVYLYEN